MPITRRTIIRILAALSAAPSLSSLGCHGARSVKSALHGGPDPKSLYVLFEGPWIIDQPDSANLRATTFGHLATTMGSVTHNCVVGLGHSGDYDLDNPRNVDGIATPLNLGIGESWTIATQNSKSDSMALAKLFGGSAYSKDPFVYVTKSGMKVIPKDGDDRTVTLPIPDSVYVGGIMSNAIVTISPSLLAPLPGSANPPAKPLPYGVTIFKYTNYPNLELSPWGGSVVKLAAAQHLVFRMTFQGMGASTETQHVQDAFATLASRIKKGATELSASLSTTSTDLASGPNTDGFGGYEMGLKHITAYFTNYTDCGGGGIVFGG